MLVILGTALLLRRLQYEAFHLIHILMSALILITVGMHRPDIAKKTLVVVIFAGSIWFADRVLRFVKFTVYSIGNTATIAPLCHGGTRIVLRKPPIGAVPGTHCFLWIPAIRATESHPFTIIATNPLEMVVAAYDGFTRDLHEHAVKNPGHILKASVDGPYGSVPDFTSFDKVIFIAGGSGASFTCAVAVETLRKVGDSTTTTIEFIWVVREQGTSKKFVF
jgi:predicted ferric reductase